MNIKYSLFFGLAFLSAQNSIHANGGYLTSTIRCGEKSVTFSEFLKEDYDLKNLSENILKKLQEVGKNDLANTLISRILKEGLGYVLGASPSENITEPSFSVKKSSSEKNEVTNRKYFIRYKDSNEGAKIEYSF